MKLTAVSFENYKSFKKEESIEIKPLTVLIGRNNAGKSVIARLPLLISHALSDRAVSPLDLEFDGLDFGSSFVDLIHNRNPHGAVSVGATFDMEAGTITFKTGVQHYDEYKLQFVNRHELYITTFKEDKKFFSMKVERSETDPLKECTRFKDIETNRDYEIKFNGLLPSSKKFVKQRQVFYVFLF
ncbi:MAG TPA: AAA family ATPase [Thermodesulfovibrionia bacterium]|nr:AAA family ATPase [Thermodesulfovibrionia bacterium]